MQRFHSNSFAVRRITRTESVPSYHAQLNHALSHWPQWQCKLKEKPRLIRRLQGGYTNHSFLLASDENQLVLRLHHASSHQLGIDREREAKILTHLSPLDIAPTLQYLAEDHCYSVLSYIEGTVWPESAFTSPKNRAQLSHVIKKYQQVDITLSRFDYVKHVSAYWRRYVKVRPAAAARDRAEWQAFLQALQSYQARCKRYALSHHDITPANIIETKEGIKIIDWEYAALGFSALDTYALDRAAQHRHSRPRARKSSDIISQLNKWMMRLWWGIA